MAEIRVDTRAPEMTTEAPGVYQRPDTQVADAVANFGNTLNEFAQRYGAWQNHIAITKAGTQLEAHVQDAKTALDQSPDPAATWQHISSSYGDAVTNATEGHNPYVATHVKEMYDRAHIGLQAYAQATIYKHTKTVAADSLQQASTQGAASVYKDPTATDNVLAALQSSYTGQVGTLYPDQASAQRDYGDAAANVVDAGVNKYLANKDFAGAQGYLDKYGNYLSPDQETAAKYHIESLQRRQDDINLEQAKGIFNDQLARVANTGTVDAQQVSQINQLLADPKLARQRADINSTLNMAKQAYLDSQKWGDMSADQIRADVGKFKPDDPNNAAAYQLAQKHEIAAERYIKARNDDPALYMRQRGYSSYTGIEQQEQKLGLPVKPFTNNQAAEIGSEIHNAKTAQEKRSIIATILNGDPKHGIDGAGMTGLHQVIEAAKLSPSIALTRDMKLSAAQAYFEVKALPPAQVKTMIAARTPGVSEATAVHDWNSKIQRELQPYVLSMQGVNPSNYMYMQDAVSAIALGYAEQGKSNPIAHAVQDLNEGVKVSGKLMMPEQADPLSVHYHLHQHIATIKPTDLYTPPGMDSYTYWAIQKPQAHWVLDSTDGAAKYVLYGAGGPMFNKDGSLVTVPVDKATKKLTNLQSVEAKGIVPNEAALYDYVGID